MAKSAAVPWKAMLPPEHGSWAFVLEPVLIAGALGAPGPGFAVFLLYLAYRPLVLAARDLAKRKRYPRTVPSFVLGAGLGALGLVLLFASAPLALVGSLLGLGGLFAIVDQRASARSLIRELLGSILALPVALVLVPSSFLVPLLLRPFAAVLSVRAVFARTEDAAFCRWMGIGLGFALVAQSLLNAAEPLRAAAYLVAGARAVWLGLSWKQERCATRVGIAEALVSVAVVLAWWIERTR
jgi:hypothetical protein